MAPKKKQAKRGAKTPRSSFRRKPATKRKPTNKRAANKPAAASRPAPLVGGVRLGEVTAPSGKLAIFDIGLYGYLPRDALEPALVVANVPRDAVLDVIGHRVGKGRFADCWDHVAVRLGDGEVAHAHKLGEAGVDFARLICIDHTALDHWQHDDSLDGRADFVFWGRDAAKLATVLRAPRIADGYGWTDLAIADADAVADRAARLKAENHWLLAFDVRPHSHHFHALAAARANPAGAGTIEVGGAKLCLFFTSWGDGVFPIYLDADHDDRPVQIRIQLATVESNAAIRAVNR